MSTLGELTLYKYLRKSVAPLGFFCFFLGGRGKIGYVTKKWRHILYCTGAWGMPPWILGLWNSISIFLHFKGTFEQNIKVLNHIFNSVSMQGGRSLMFTLMFIFKKYFSPNLMPRTQNVKDFPYNLMHFFNKKQYDLQFNSIIKGTRNSFLIKQLFIKLQIILFPIYWKSTCTLDCMESPLCFGFSALGLDWNIS